MPGSPTCSSTTGTAGGCGRRRRRVGDRWGEGGRGPTSCRPSRRRSWRNLRSSTRAAPPRPGPSAPPTTEASEWAGAGPRRRRSRHLGPVPFAPREPGAVDVDAAPLVQTVVGRLHVRPARPTPGTPPRPHPRRHRHHHSLPHRGLAVDGGVSRGAWPGRTSAPTAGWSAATTRRCTSR